MIAEERVIGVLVLASTESKRTFAPDELALLQALASEAALALERLRSEAALSDALRARAACRRDRPPDPGRARACRSRLGSRATSCARPLRLDEIAIDVTDGEARVQAERELPLAPGEQFLVETVAREIGAALHTARSWPRTGAGSTSRRRFCTRRRS